MTTRRLRRLMLTPRMFVALCTGTADRHVRAVANALPEGCEVWGEPGFDVRANVLWIYITHPSFDAIPYGEMLPEHPSVIFEDLAHG